MQDEHDEDGAADARPGDVEHFLQPVGAVDVGRFVQLRVDPGERCKVNDAVPSEFFPDVGYPDEGAEAYNGCERRNFRETDACSQLVDDTVGGKHVDENTG